MKPLSVIMGVHNQKNKEELYRAVDSVLKQSYSEFEFIIYDDGSEEAEASMLKELEKYDDRIRVIRGEENKGLAYGLNQCLKVSQGKYIARMDADDISKADRFRAQIDFLEANGSYGWCGCSADLFDSEGVWGRRIMPLNPGVTELLKYSPYIHPSVIFRKNVLEESGGYLVTEDTKRCEDYELFLRLHAMGYCGYNLQETLFCYQEDRFRYDKRTWKQRISEMKIRYAGFKKMGIAPTKSLVYVIKPVMIMFVPNLVRSRIRHLRK